MVACPLWVSGESLPRVGEFMYLGCLFMSEGKMPRKIDRRLKELNPKANL